MEDSLNPYEKKHLLDGLDELSVENLKAGRITRTAMAYAVLKTGATAGNAYFFDRGRLGGCMGGSESDRMLADTLNDMLEAAKPSEEAPPPKPTPSEYNGIEGFIPELRATVRECIDCGCLVPGGPTRCRRCAKEVKMEKEEPCQNS